MKTFKNIREGAENYTMKKGPYTRKVDGKTADKMKRQGWKLVAREEIEEVRQMKDPKKDVMVVKRGKTIVIDKSKEKEYLRKGWSLAEDASLEEKINPKEFSKLQGTYKDKISGAVIEFDSNGFVVEPKNGKVVPFEWKNMMAEAVSQAQQAAIAIAKKEKGEKSKTEDKGQFIYAAKQAKKKGEKTFVFANKTYNCEEVLEDKEMCPKCEGKGCDHCDDIGYHEAHKKGSKCKTESFESFMNEAVANITVDPRNKISKPADQNKHAMAISKNAKRMGLKSSMMGKHVRIKGNKKAVNDFLRVVIGRSTYGDPTEKDMTTPQIDKMLNKGMKGKNEEKLNEATVIPQVKDIVSKKQAKKIQGVMVDMFTASAISQIYDKVNDTNKTKMDKMKVGQLANLAMKLMKKEETELKEDAKIKEISRLTGTRPQAVQDFISKNNLDVFKLLQYVGRGKSPERMAFSNAISSKPNSKTKNFIKQFQEETELKEKRFSAKRDAMKDMGKSGKDSADDDDYKATDDDRKAASKNVIYQIRKGCDMPKGAMIKFKDGSSKNFPKKACQLVMTKFDSIKKPMVKRKFQDMVNQSFAGLKKALSMKG